MAEVQQHDITKKKFDSFKKSISTMMETLKPGSKIYSKNGTRLLNTLKEQLLDKLALEGKLAEAQSEIQKLKDIQARLL